MDDETRQSLQDNRGSSVRGEAEGKEFLLPISEEVVLVVIVGLIVFLSIVQSNKKRTEENPPSRQPLHKSSPRQAGASIASVQR